MSKGQSLASSSLRPFCQLRSLRSTRCVSYGIYASCVTLPSVALRTLHALHWMETL